MAEMALKSVKIMNMSQLQAAYDTISQENNMKAKTCSRKAIKKLIFPLFTLNETFIKRTPLLSRRGHLKSTLNSHFYCYQPVLNEHL